MLQSMDTISIKYHIRRYQQPIQYIPQHLWGSNILPYQTNIGQTSVRIIQTILISTEKFRSFRRRYTFTTKPDCIWFKEDKPKLPVENRLVKSSGQVEGELQGNLLPTRGVWCKV